MTKLKPMLLLLLVGFPLSSACFAARTPASKAAAIHPCLNEKNPLCGNILKLQPGLDKDYAMQLSNDFLAVARSYRLPVQLLVSIANQESSFRLKVVRMVKGLVLDLETYKPATVGSDFCMMQINVVNIQRLDLDPKRLVEDSRYCIEAGARILSDSVKFKSSERTWWTRYNAVSDLHRKIYQEHVLKHWRKLDPNIDDHLGFVPQA